MEKWSDIEPEQLLQMLESGEIKPSRIIDVREPFEWDYYHLPASRHVPMNMIPSRLDELSRDDDLYILCAHGVRSVYVCRYLQEKGYGGLRNISGGIASIAMLKGFQYD